MTVVFADAEYGVREWAKDDDDISAIVGTKVFFGVPKGQNLPLPFLVVYRSGGMPENGEAPLDDARITFDCWASTKKQAAELAAAVVSAAHSLKPGTEMGLGLVGLGAEVLLQLWQPDTEKDLPRYVVDVRFKVRAS